MSHKKKPIGYASRNLSKRCLFSPGLLEEMVREHVGVEPKSVDILNDVEVVIVFEENVDIRVVAETLGLVEQFSDRQIKMICMIKEQSFAKEYSNVKKQQSFLSIPSGVPTPGDIPTPQVGGVEDFAKGLIQAITCLGEAHTSSSIAPSLGTGFSNKIPKISTFTGQDKEKGDVDFAQWSFKVKTYLEGHTEKSMREAIIRSLKGNAASTVRMLGTAASVKEILGKIEKVYGSVSTSDTMFFDLYHLEQQQQEGVQTFVSRVEVAIDKIRAHYPEVMTQSQVDLNLKDRLFGGLKNDLKNSLWYPYDRDGTDYTELMAAARKAEAEVGKCTSV